MNKTTQFAIRGGAYGFLGGFLFTLLRQLMENPNNVPFKPNWEECFLNGAKIGTIGAGVGLAIGVVSDEKNEIATALGTSLFLRNILSENEVNSIDYQIKRKLEKLSKALMEKFSDKLEGEPQIGGSHDRDVAIISSDHDMRIHFKPKSYKLEEMYEDVYCFFDKEYLDNSLKKIRRQTHSLGLYFEINGREERIDIVPMQRIDGNRDYNLLVNNDSDFEANSRIKTNPNKQSKYSSGFKGEKELVKLLKIWRDENKIKFPSIYLEMLVADCFKDCEGIVSSDLEQKILRTLRYIQNKITHKRIVDPSNSNNIISDALTNSEKEEISSIIRNMLEDISETPQNIASYFPNLN